MEILQLFFYLPAVSLAHFLLLPFSFLSNKFFRSFRLQALPTFEGKTLIIVPSVGELEYVLPIVAEIPKNELALCYFSPSFEPFVGKNQDRFSGIFKLPLDSLFGLVCFMNLRPREVIFSRMQIWPFFLFYLQVKRIPTYLVSGNLKGKSFSNAFKRMIYRPWLKTFNHIFLEDEKDQEIGTAMKLKNISLAGNPRMDRVIEKKEKIADCSWLKSWIPEDHRLLILASVWKKDLEIISSDLTTLVEEFGFKVIIAPHEYDSSYDPLEAECFYSTERAIKKTASYCVVNEMGLLFSLFQFGNCVYVGGGFGGDVHSTLEPAVFGNRLFFGPNISRSGEAKTFVQGGGAKIIYQAGDLLKGVLDAQIDGGKNLELLNLNKGASTKIKQEIFGN